MLSQCLDTPSLGLKLEGRASLLQPILPLCPLIVFILWGRTRISEKKIWIISLVSQQKQNLPFTQLWFPDKLLHWHLSQSEAISYPPASFFTGMKIKEQVDWGNTKDMDTFDLWLSCRKSHFTLKVFSYYHSLSALSVHAPVVFFEVHVFTVVTPRNFWKRSI